MSSCDKTFIAAALAKLQAGLIERDEAVQALLLALLAGEHVLLIGPPGAAKSQLARRLSAMVKDGVYFERLLTKFSVPEELFGPLSIKALEADRFERKTQGFLPEAHVAFIDEVFKASSAILNTLLLMLNERAFDNGDMRQHVPLMTVVAASNEVPQEEALAAFYDRFALRVQVAPVSDEGFASLLQLKDEAFHASSPLTREDLQRLRDAAAQLNLSDELVGLLKALRQFTHGQGWRVSDRRWRKLVHIMQLAAAANGRRQAQVWDALLAAYVLPPHPEQAAAVLQWIAEQLGVWQAYDAPRFTKVIEAFEATLEQEHNARDVVTTDTGSGKGQFMKNNIGESEVSTESMRLDSGMMRQRRYGPQHIATRQAQVRELIAQMQAYLDALQSRRADVGTLKQELFVPQSFVPRATAVLDQTAEAIALLQARAQALILGFEKLPRMAEPAPQSIAAQ